MLHWVLLYTLHHRKMSDQFIPRTLFKKLVHSTATQSDVSAGQQRNTSDFPWLECRVLKALSERLKRDAAAREAAKDFEIKESGEHPSSMRVMPSRGESAATRAEE